MSIKIYALGDIFTSLKFPNFLLSTTCFRTVWVSNIVEPRLGLLSVRAAIQGSIEGLL